MFINDRVLFDIYIFATDNNHLYSLKSERDSRIETMFVGLFLHYIFLYLKQFLYFMFYFINNFIPLFYFQVQVLFTLMYYRNFEVKRLEVAFIDSTQWNFHL